MVRATLDAEAERDGWPALHARLAGIAPDDPELAAFYAGLVESEGNHYAAYLIMARHIDEPETDRRLDWYLNRDAELIRQSHSLPILH